MSLTSCLRMVKRASGSSWPKFSWHVPALKCAGRSSAPPAQLMWSSGVVWTWTTWCLSTLGTGYYLSIHLLTSEDLHSLCLALEKWICHLLRNTAVDTVEQELLFVGTENGKLVAMRDIIKKVRALYFEFNKNSCVLILFWTTSSHNWGLIFADRLSPYRDKEWQLQSDEHKLHCSTINNFPIFRASCLQCWCLYSL